MDNGLFGMFGVPSGLWETPQSSHASAMELVRPLMRDHLNNQIDRLKALLQQSMDDRLAQMSADVGLIYCPVSQAAALWRQFRAHGYIVTRPIMDKIPYRYARLWMIEVRRTADGVVLLTVVIINDPAGSEKEPA